MTFADKAINYFTNLEPNKNLPSSIHIMNPYTQDDTHEILVKFYKKFFNDNKKRTLAFGINPGRFGGGITGVSFTDPAALEEHCGIKNNFKKQSELSSKFVYKFISEYGGVDEFYENCFLSALYPLALIKDGKNYNYYDQIKLYNILKDDIVKNIKSHIEFGGQTNFAISLGRKNGKFFEEINNEYKFFGRIIILDHPRYIMQYKLKKMDDYIAKYLQTFNN